MKKAQLLITLALLTLLVAVNQYSKDPSKSFFGGLPWWGWTAIGLFLLAAGIVGLGLWPAPVLDLVAGSVGQAARAVGGG